ncbi:MAG: MarR family transcriptional regulator [Rhizomicrobium sp.]
MKTATLTRAPAPARKPADRGEGGVARGGLEDSVGFHLRMAFLAVSRHFTGATARLDLTQKQTGVLWMIGANAGISQTKLASALSMDRASMMAIIDRLDHRQLLIRERSDRDGRRQELYLTPKGQKVLAQSKAAVAEHEKWIAAHFDKDELAALLALLHRIEL